MKTPIEVYAVFDLETTGAHSRNHFWTPKGSNEQKQGNGAIIEIAVCPFDKNLNDLPEYNSGVMNVNSDRGINQIALDKNNITMDQIKNGRDPAEVAKEFKYYMKSLSRIGSKIVLCGQNIDKFDIPFLVDYLSEYNIDLSTLANEDYTIDTMWWARTKYVESVNYKLGTLCANENIDLQNAHRAINDTRANKDLVKKYIRNLRGEGQTSVEEKEDERFRVNFEM
jgi:DNA polymerase III epsilon subunit-like protein